MNRSPYDPLAPACEQAPAAALNTRLIAWTLAILLTAGVSAWWLRGRSLQHNSAMLLTQAEQASANGRNDEALAKYRQFLEFSRSVASPGDAALNQRAAVLTHVIGLLEARPEELSQFRELYHAYEECLRLNPDQPEIRRQFVALLMRMPRFRDALSHLARLKETAEPGRELAEILYLTGSCLEAEEKYAESQQALLESIQNWSAQTVAYLRLAQLWTNHPDRIAPIPAVQLPAGPEWQTVARIIQPVEERLFVSSGQAAEAVLHAMQHQFPKPAAALEAARFLVGLQLGDDRLPMSAGAAETLHLAVFAAAEREVVPLDGTGEGPQPSLAFIDRWSPLVPAFADADGDGVVTRDELRRRLLRGDALTRIDRAEQLLRSIPATDEAGSGGSEQRLALIHVLTRKSEVARLQAPDEALPALEAAQAVLQESMGNSGTDIRFQMARLAVEGQVQEGPGQPSSLARLDATIGELRTMLAELDSDTDKSATASDWTTGGRTLHARWLEIELRFDLAGALLSKVAMTPAEERVQGLADVQVEVDHLRRLGALPQYVDYLRVRRLMIDRDYRSAATLGSGLRDQMARTSPLARQMTQLLAECYERLGNLEGRMEAYQSHLLHDPLWVAGRAGLAEGLVEVGRLDEAIEQYRPATSVTGFGERLLELLIVRNATVSPDRRNWDEADALCEALAARTADTLELQLLTSELRLLQAVTWEFLGRREQDPTLQERARERLAEAEQALAAARAAHPENREVRLEQANLAIRQFALPVEERLTLAETILQECRRDLGASVECDLLEARLLLERRAPEAPAQLWALAEVAQNTPPASQVELLAGLASVAARAGELGLVEKLWRRVRKLQADHLQARLALAQLILARHHHQTLEANDAAIWKQLLDEIQAIEQSSEGSVAYLNAMWILDEPAPESVQRAADLTHALELMQTVARQRPNWSAVPRALGLIEERLDHRDAALEHYLRAIELGDRSPEVIRRVIVEYSRQKRYRDAEALLQQVGAEDSELLAGDLGRLAWRISWSRQQFDQALGLAREVSRESTSADDHIALALMQFVQHGPSAEVEAELRTAAYELKPDAVEPWVALIGLYARTRQWESAETTLHDAQSRLVQSGKAAGWLAVGGLYELLVAVDAPRRDDYLRESDAAYAQALQLQGNDDAVLVAVADHRLRVAAPDTAIPLLEKLLDPARTVPVETQRWAIRRLAQALAADGRMDRIQQGLALLRTAAKDGLDRTPDNLRLQLELMGRLPRERTAADREAILKQLQMDTTLSEDEQLQLAQLLDARGDHEAARTEYLALLKAHPAATAARASYIVSLCRQLAETPAALDEAEAQYEQLQELRPQAWSTTLVRARLLAASDQQAEAAAVIDRFLKSRFEGLVSDAPREFLEREHVPDVIRRLRHDRRVQADPAIREAVLRAEQLWRTGRREECFVALLRGPAKAALEDQRLDVLLEAGMFCEEWQLPAAEELFRRYARRSQRPGAALELAGYLVRHQRVTEALQLCESIWQAVPASGLGYVLLNAAGQTPAGERQSLAVWRDRLATLAARPDHPERWLVTLQLGELDQLIGAWQAAIAGYRQAASINPRDVVARNNLAYTLARTAKSPEEQQEAVRAIDEAIAIAGPVPALLDTQAVVLMHAGRSEEALAIMLPLSKTSEKPGIAARLAEVYWRLNRLPEARAALAEARQRGWRVEEVSGLDRAVMEELLGALEEAASPSAL